MQGVGGPDQSQQASSTSPSDTIGGSGSSKIPKRDGVLKKLLMGAKDGKALKLSDMEPKQKKHFIRKIAIAVVTAAVAVAAAVLTGGMAAVGVAVIGLLIFGANSAFGASTEVDSARDILLSSSRDKEIDRAKAKLAELEEVDAFKAEFNELIQEGEAEEGEAEEGETGSLPEG